VRADSRRFTVPEDFLHRDEMIETVFYGKNEWIS
jgi:hypothetical protein